MSSGYTSSSSSEVNDCRSCSSYHRGRSQTYHWGMSEVISEPILGGDVNTMLSNTSRIAIEDNKIYVVWEDKSNVKGSSTDYDIFYRHYNGKIWSELQVLSEPELGKNLNLGESHSPDIVVKDGKIYVVWADDNNTDGSGFEFDIFYRCNLTGSGWETIQVISEPLEQTDTNKGWSIVPSIAVERGELHVVWQDDSNYNNAAVDWDIFYRANLTGSGWEDIQVISEPVKGKDFNTGESRSPEIAVEANDVHVVWEDNNITNGAGTDVDIFYRGNRTGVNWESIQVISEPVIDNNLNSGRSKDPSIAVEASKIFVAWSDKTNLNGAGVDFDIFYRLYDNTQWSELQVVSEPQVGNNINIGGSHSPSIAVENSKLYLVWHDRNNTLGAGLDPDILFRQNITGHNWDASQLISEPVVAADLNTGTSEYPDIAVFQGKTHIVWMDDNVTNDAGPDKDIFYKCTFVSPILTEGKVMPASGYSSTYFNFTVNYTDADNEAPLYIKVSISGTNYTMEESNRTDESYYNGKLYFYNSTLGIGLGYNYRFYCSDGTYSLSTSLIDNPDVLNFVPQILTPDNETAYEDTYFEVRYEFLDKDFGQTHTWNFKSDAGWLSFNPTTAVLKGTPTDNDIGDHWVNISIQDSIGGKNSTNFTITVIELNDPPVITTSDNTSAYEDELYEVEYHASDMDTPLSTLKWSFSTDAYWLNFNLGTLILTGTPTNDEVGQYWVNISVNDTEGGLDFSNFTLIVLNVNDLPVIITEDLETAALDEFYSVKYEAVDPDSSLTWSFNTNAGKWLKLDLKSGWLNGTPTQNEVGMYWVNISVADGEGGLDFHNFTLTVQPPPNKPPELNTSDVRNITVAGELFKVAFSAVDDNTPAANLTWGYFTNAEWLKFDNSTQVLSGNPTDANLGEFWANISVMDDEGGILYYNFTLTVEPSENNAPVLTGGKHQPESGDTDTTFTFSVHYYDEDGDPPSSINIVVDGKEYEMSLDSGNVSNGTYVLKTKLSKGTHAFYFNANDGKANATAGDTLTPISDSTIRTTTKVNEVEGEIDWILIILIIIILILVIAIIAVVIARSRKRAAEEVPTEPEVEPEKVQKKRKKKGKPKKHLELEEEPFDEEAVDLEEEEKADEFEFEIEDEPEELFEWDEE